MKKLLILILFGFLFISCINQPKNTTKQNNTQQEEYPAIPRSEWDAEEIAYTNTTELVSNGAMTYNRVSGTTGIIGNFHNEAEVYAGMVGYTAKYDYTIDTDGYYTSYNLSYSKSKGLYETISKYKFKLVKYSDEYFIIELYNIETGALYEKMFTNFINAENGVVIRP